MHDAFCILHRLAECRMQNAECECEGVNVNVIVQEGVRASGAGRHPAARDVRRVNAHRSGTH